MTRPNSQMQTYAKNSYFKSKNFINDDNLQLFLKTQNSNRQKFVSTQQQQSPSVAPWDQTNQGTFVGSTHFEKPMAVDSSKLSAT